jgi:hypothetical protein
MPELLVLELARAFWQAAGEWEPFPRQLRRPIAMALPLGVVDLPRLRVAGLDDWLARHGLSCRSGVRDRPLRAALVAFAGHGLVIVDGLDPDDERRFSLAHELAHFLSDYWWPRARVARQLGPSSLEVLDGRRPATPTERIDAVLANVALGAHVHLMERTASGHHPGAAVTRAEQLADALALELLAPAALATPLVRAATADPVAVLVQRFDLPVAVAASYAAQLLAPETTAGSALRQLGLGDLLDLSNFVELARNKE